MKSTVTSCDISRAVRELGIEEGDVVLVHSSMKSLGHVEGGPEAVIRGFEDVLGKEGTLVLPTLSQVDFVNSYRTWYMDKPSDTGLLTEYFRKQMYVYRSNQATHSVAARGKLAYELTHEHGDYGRHICAFGDTAFADSSPWMKMYHMNAKIVFLGCSPMYCTMKHAIECLYAEDLLARIKDDAKREELYQRLRRHPEQADGVWFYFHNDEMIPCYEEKGYVTRSTCGDAALICMQSKPCMDMAYELLDADPARWLDEGAPGLQWILDCKAAAK